MDLKEDMEIDPDQIEDTDFLIDQDDELEDGEVDDDEDDDDDMEEDEDEEDDDEEEGQEDEEGYNEKEITVLEEKGKNTFEVLPGGWLEVRHSSGMPLYLHRKTRVCTLAKPYFLGPGSVRKHSIPLNGIPCLAYKRAIEREKEVQNGCPMAASTRSDSTQASPPTPLSPSHPQEIQLECSEGQNQPEGGQDVKREYDLKMLPLAKVETAKENNEIFSVEPLELREYCQTIFAFKQVKCKRFKTWSARRKHTKEQKRIQLQRPSLPEGVKLITFPIHNPDGLKGKDKQYIMNPQGKSSVCILHEYVQHALRKQPSYQFRELENAATPYSATVIINNMQYGTGFGSSKKQAKAEAAKTTIEILIPQMKDQLDNSKSSKDEMEYTAFFDQIEMDDSRITKMCANVSEPSPYALLLTCLQRNFGKGESSNIKFEMISTGTQANKFKMESGEYSVEVTASNKREGKQLASQAMLAKIHPHIKNFGSFLRLYGNGSVKSVKEKKQEEQQITILQSKASANSPNYAILKKLREEMRKLEHAEEYLKNQS